MGRTLYVDLRGLRRLNQEATASFVQIVDTDLALLTRLEQRQLLLLQLPLILLLMLVLVIVLSEADHLLVVALGHGFDRVLLEGLLLLADAFLGRYAHQNVLGDLSVGSNHV